MNPLQVQRLTSAFTLIELMISLCIIGILASVAIPNFLSFRARSMQSEAKANLAALQRAEVAYQAEHNTFTDNLKELAWRPTGKPRYIYGFVSDATPAASGLNDSAELAASVTVEYVTSAMLTNGTPLTDADLPGTATATRSAFIFGASANVDDDGTLDQWTVNERNTIVNVQGDPSL